MSHNEGPEYDQPPPDGMAQRVQEYVAWATKKRANGAVEGEEKLREDTDLAIEPDGSTGEVAAVPGAAEIARTCPHVRYGGRIVIREIEPT